MAHQRSEQIRVRWNREFQHDSLTIGDFVKLFEQSREQEPIAFGSLRTFDIHFRLDDRDQAVLQNLIRPILAQREAIQYVIDHAD